MSTPSPGDTFVMQEISDDSNEDYFEDYDNVPWEHVDYEKVHTASAWTAAGNAPLSGTYQKP